MNIQIKGLRKFIVVILSLLIFAILSYASIVSGEESALLIGAIGGGLAGLQTPFMASNYGENKVENGGLKKS